MFNVGKGVRQGGQRLRSRQFSQRRREKSQRGSGWAANAKRGCIGRQGRHLIQRGQAGQTPLRIKNKGAAAASCLACCAVCSRYRAIRQRMKSRDRPINRSPKKLK